MKKCCCFVVNGYNLYHATNEGVATGAGKLIRRRQGAMADKLTIIDDCSFKVAGIAVRYCNEN